MKYKHEFEARLHPLAERLGYDELAIIDQFLAGLPEKVEEEVTMAGGHLTNVISVVQQYTNLLESRQAISNKEVTFLCK